MSAKEVECVAGFIQSVHKWGGLTTPHVTERKRHWNVTDAEILSTISHGDVLEVHRNNAPDVRAVLRLDIGLRGISVTVSLVDFKVITVWINAIDDRHSTLNMSGYAWGGSLLPVLASLYAGVAV